LIAANERRLSGLPTHKVEAEKSQLSKVRNFQKQAQDALSTGDTEGAKTLATKAKLLLDDIDKL
jgi:ribosomal protein S20